MPEIDMVSQWWKGKDTPPKTAEPNIIFNKNMVKITSNTEGVSIGYRKSSKDTWTAYQKPFEWKTGDSLYVVAHRIGYDKVVNTVKK